MGLLDDLDLLSHKCLVLAIMISIFHVPKLDWNVMFGSSQNGQISSKYFENQAPLTVSHYLTSRMWRIPRCVSGYPETVE